jgi:hypothetical protein
MNKYELGIMLLPFMSVVIIWPSPYKSWAPGTTQCKYKQVWTTFVVASINIVDMFVMVNTVALWKPRAIVIGQLKFMTSLLQLICQRQHAMVVLVHMRPPLKIGDSVFHRYWWFIPDTQHSIWTLENTPGERL